MWEVAKGFLKTKKGMTVVAGGIVAAVGFLFPESAGWIADVLAEAADKLQPETAGE